MDKFLYISTHAGPKTGACGSIYWKDNQRVDTYHAHYVEIHAPSEHTIDMVRRGGCKSMRARALKWACHETKYVHVYTLPHLLQVRFPMEMQVYHCKDKSRCNYKSDYMVCVCSYAATALHESMLLNVSPLGTEPFIHPCSFPNNIVLSRPRWSRCSSEWAIRRLHKSSKICLVLAELRSRYLC